MPFRTLKDVGDLFAQQSKDTSEQLGLFKDAIGSESGRVSFRLSEDAITTFFMLSLHRQGCTIAVFEQTSGQAEAESGTDFEIWFGSKVRGWYRFAIQAKKLDPSSNNIYTHIAYHNPNREEPQIDFLQKYAQKNRAAPLYCLYNYTQDHTGDIAKEAEHWHCCTRNFDLQELGCTITPLRNVQRATKKGERGLRNFDWIHKNKDTFPLRCLVCCRKVTDSLQVMPEGPVLERPGLFDPASCYHESLPLALLEAEAADESERGGMLRSVPMDRYWGLEETRNSGQADATGYDREAGLPKFVAVLDIEDFDTHC